MSAQASSPGRHCKDENIPTQASMRHRYADSSDSVPNSRDESFYNALCCEGSNIARRGSLQMNDVCLPRANISPQETIDPLCSKTVTQTPNIHIPTKLDTIIEQKSISTLRHSASLSQEQKASIILQLSRKPTIEALKEQATARRKTSFSLNDISGLKYLTRVTRLFQRTSSSSHISYSDEYCHYPARPIQHAPHRASTPEGLPTFNTTEAINYRVSPPPMRFRDLFHVNRTPAELEWHRQTVGLPRGVVMRADNGTVVRGRFRPCLSGHTGTPMQRQQPPDILLDQTGQLQAPPRTTSLGRGTGLGVSAYVRMPLSGERQDLPSPNPQQAHSADWELNCARWFCCISDADIAWADQPASVHSGVGTRSSEGHAI